MPTLGENVHGITITKNFDDKMSDSSDSDTPFKDEVQDDDDCPPCI